MAMTSSGSRRLARRWLNVFSHLREKKGPIVQRNGEMREPEFHLHRQPLPLTFLKLPLEPPVLSRERERTLLTVDLKLSALVVSCLYRTCICYVGLHGVTLFQGKAEEVNCNVTTIPAQSDFTTAPS